MRRVSLLLLPLAVLITSCAGAKPPSDAPSRPIASGTPSTRPPLPFTTPLPTPSRPASYVPKPEEIALQVKVLSKRCFTVNCLVIYRIVPSYTGSQEVVHDAKVTYLVSGPKDGPQLKTFTMSGTRVGVERMSTKSPTVQVTVKVVAVSAR